MYANLYYLYRRDIMPYTPPLEAFIGIKRITTSNSFMEREQEDSDNKHGKSIYCCRFIGKIKSNYDMIVF